MGIQCRIIRNKEGKVSYVEAPNGNRSKLYDDAVAKVGEESALDIVLTAYTPSFTEEVKNPKIVEYRKQLVDKINSIPSTAGNISIKLNGINKVLDINTLQMVTEDLGNGETLITFKADLDTRNSMVGQTPVAPNGELSNLNQKQWEQVRTPAFMEWSNNWADVIKDENGEPQLHYHGTAQGARTTDNLDERVPLTEDNKFYTFDSGIGVEFFTPRKEVALTYAGFGGETGVYTVFVKSPKTLNTAVNTPQVVSKFIEKNWAKIAKHAGIRNKGKEATLNQIKYDLKNSSYNWEILEYPPLMEFLKEQGYTGMRTLEQGGNIGVFDNTAIKSATDNVGTFDNTDPDIRFSISKGTDDANFKKWKGGNKLVEGADVQKVKTGEPVVIRGYHGTTNEFYEFDSSVKGTIEGHLGRVNYFTTEESDATQNYHSTGADLTNRVERETSMLIDNLREEYEDFDESESFDKFVEDYNITEEELRERNLTRDTVDPAENLAEILATRRLVGGQDKTLDVYIKLNNPAVIGRGMNYHDFMDRSQFEDSLDEASEEIAKENGITIEEAKEDYQFDVEIRAMELAGYENPLQSALEQAISDNSYDYDNAASKASEILQDFYDSEIELSQIEKKIREELAFEENEDGEMSSAQIVSDFFKNLGFDGIILTDVSSRFNMNLDTSTSHVHVFNEYNNQIKLADGTNTTFGDTSDIRYSSNKPIYTANFVYSNVLIAKYGKKHPNVYATHSTIEFRPKSTEGLPIGEQTQLKVVGRLTTDKVDVLIVENPLSKNKHPHITLSTAEGVMPKESNSEIENNLDKIQPLNDTIESTVGTFDGGNINLRETNTPLEMLQGLANRLKTSGLAKEVNIVSEAEIKKALEQKGHKYQQGINGFALGDVVYINKDRAGLDTPIHEFGHLWNSWMQENAPEVFKKGIDLIKAEGDSYVEKVKRTQPKLKGDAIYEEALAQAIGDNGALLLGESQRKSFMDWLAEAWESMKGALGLANTSLEEFQTLTLDEFSKRAATDLLSGQSLSALMNSQVGTVGAALTVTGTTRNSTAFPDKMYNVDYVYDLDKKSLEEIVDEYEGRVFGITSDATGIKLDSKGEPIYGGAGYVAIKKNVDDKIGFASMGSKEALGQLNSIFDRYGANKKVAILVMVQNPTPTLGNSYAAKYFSRGLKEISLNNPKAYAEISESIIEQFEKNNDIKKELKKEGTKDKLINLLRNVDTYTEQEFIDEFLLDTSFKLRVALLSKILPKHSTIGQQVNTPIASVDLKELGYTQFDFLKEYGDDNFFDDKMYMDDFKAGKGTGKFFVSGFEFETPASKDMIPQMIEDTKDRGLTHPLFNGKIPSTGKHFFLDGRYNADTNFADYGAPRTEVVTEGKNGENKELRAELDALTRATYTKDGDYDNASLSKPMEERGYGDLKTTRKIKFKDTIILPNYPHLYTAKPAEVGTDIARSLYFKPVTEEAREAMMQQSEDTGFVRFSMGEDLTQGSLSSLLMRGQFGMLTAENPNAKKTSDKKNAEKNAKAKEWLKEKGYKAIPITGYYGNKENSFIVPDLTIQDAVDFAIKFDQESVATNEGLVYQDGTMNPRNRREDSYGGTFEDFYSSIELDGKPFNFAVGYDLNKKIDIKVHIKTKEQIDSEAGVEDRGTMPFLTRDGEGNYVFYHYSTKERNEIDPKKSGSNPNSITSSIESSAISKVGGVAMFYTKTANKESGTGNYGHLVKIPMGKVYDMNKDPDNLLAVARERFEKKYPKLGFDANHQAAFITQVAIEKGYDMAVIKWGALYRAQTTKKLAPVEKEIVESGIAKSTFTDYDSGKPKFSIGFMQTKETPQGEQVKLSNVDDQVQGKGLGTEMYKKKATKNSKEGKSLVADNNSKGAEGIWNKFADAGVIEPVSIGDAVTDRIKITPDSFDVNGEPNVNDVIQFIQSKNYEGETLSQEEMNEVSNVLLGTTFESSDDLFRALKRGFMPNGVYNPSETSLMASGVYSRVEARRLLDTEEAQLKAYEMMHKIKNSDTIPNATQVDSTYITVTSSYNSFGTLKKANPFLNEKTAREILGGIKDETLFSNQAEANSLEFANKKFNELSALTKVTKMKVEGGRTFPHTNIDDLRIRLQETLTLPSDAKLINNLNYILDISNEVWNREFQNVRTLLNEVEKKSVDIGLDLSNLNEESYDKTPTEVKSLLNAVRNFAMLQNESTFEVLVGEYVTFFDISETNNTATLDLSDEVAGKKLVYTNSQQDSYNLFETQGLLPLGNNLYQRVNTNKSLEETVDIVYQTLVSGKKIIPQNAFEYDITNPANEEFVKEDIENYAAKASKDIENSSAYDTHTLKKMVLFSAYFGTKLSNNKAVPTVTSEISLIENYPSNAQYLKTDFIADFNKQMLKEKVKNSEKYNSFYKHFDISEQGIELVNNDSITMREIKPFLTPDLINHFRLKKEGINFDAVNEATNDAVNEVVLRNYYTNYPKALPLYKGTYQMDNGTLITNTTPSFLRTDEGLFEYIETVGKKALFAPLEVNNSDFKIYSTALGAPVLGEISKFNVSQGVKADKKINNLYNKKQDDELTNEIDIC